MLESSTSFLGDVILRNGRDCIDDAVTTALGQHKPDHLLATRVATDEAYSSIVQSGNVEALRLLIQAGIVGFYVHGEGRRQRGDQTNAAEQIGRASCRERACQYAEIAVVAVSLKKKHEK